MWICPTVTVENKAEFIRQLNLASKLARRVHFDVSDGTLAHRKLFGLGGMRWKPNILADIHVMSTYPHAELKLAELMKPHLVIIHAEADIDFVAAARSLRKSGIKAGLALLQHTEISRIESYLTDYDHVLVFSGNLGYQGGSKADMKLLDKVRTIRKLNPGIEIGWDGGVNDLNIGPLIEAGVNVANVGSFVQLAKQPSLAYAKLESAVNSYKRYAP